MILIERDVYIETRHVVLYTEARSGP